MLRIWGLLACVVLVTGCDKLFGKGDDEGDDDVFTDARPDPVPDAEPARYEIGGRVANLLGTGLVLELDGGEQLTFDADGNFAFEETRLDASDYTVTIATEPTSPAQTCVVRNGGGTISADDIDDIEVECAVGTLRITEVSTCFFANVPCWVEIFNASTTTSENLSAYQLRSNASPRAGGTITTQSFTLPSLVIAPGGYAIVRGRGTDDLVDGLNLVNLLVADLVPYWTANGFVELIKSTKTVDFVRFGSSATAPTTIGWNGTGAPMVNATDVYGSVVARDASASDTNAAADWTTRAFGTPGGVNDITLDADTDNDGIPDQAEVSGGRFAGLDLFAMGARTAQRDIFVEIDYMTSADPAVQPREAALDKVVASFAARGFAVHFDVGGLLSSEHNLGGGNSVANSALISLGAFNGAVNHYALKAANMDVRRQAYAHYLVFAEELTDVPAGTAGLAEVEGNDLVVALGFLNLPTGTTANTNRIDNYQAATLMHELGHNLGLLHGGNEDANFKANYVSVMNYLYSFAGLPTIGTDEGDRYRLFRSGAGCDTTGEDNLTNSPTGTTFVLDFSTGTSLALTETAIVESQGLRRAGSTGVDFNCDDAISGTVSVDVVTGITALNDYNDWANLELAFVRNGTGTSSLVEVRFDHFTDEVRPLADETGFRP